MEYVHSAVIYKKVSNLVGSNDNFLAKARKLSILLTSLDIFYTYCNTIYLFSISPCLTKISKAFFLRVIYSTIDCNGVGLTLYIRKKIKT